LKTDSLSFANDHPFICIAALGSIIASWFQYGETHRNSSTASGEELKKLVKDILKFPSYDIQIDGRPPFQSPLTLVANGHFDPSSLNWPYILTENIRSVIHHILHIAKDDADASIGLYSLQIESIGQAIDVALATMSGRWLEKSSVHHETFQSGEMSLRLERFKQDHDVMVLDGEIVPLTSRLDFRREPNAFQLLVPKTL
jgi:hypothetical protein